MRRATVNEYNKLADKLANHVGSMKYRFMNLCVKSEPVSLVSVEVLIEGKFKKLEDCCKVSKDDDYHFKLFPQYDDDMQAIMMGITRAHPEFKQEVKTISVTVPDGAGKDTDYKVKYLELTMPEVDDERYDLLTDSVKVIYDSCKAQMERANIRSKAVFASLAPGETPENLKLLDDELDKLNKQWNEHRDKQRDAKLDEINEAYNRWLSHMGQQEIARMEDEDAHGDGTAMRMRMSDFE